MAVAAADRSTLVGEAAATPAAAPDAIAQPVGRATPPAQSAIVTPGATVVVASQSVSVAPTATPPAAVFSARPAQPIASRIGVGRAAPSTRKSPASIDADSSEPDAAADAVADVAMPTQVTAHIPGHTAANATPATASTADRAANQLAAGATDRQVDLAKQGAWLDGIAHDIAATGDASSPLRFGVAPQHLGSVQVELLRSAEGAAVTLTASNEAGRAALADAKPQLLADARAQGLHIASAQVDVGGRSADSRPSSQGQSDSRPSTGSGGFSAQTGGQPGAQGDSGRNSQTRSQPLAANPARTTGVIEVAAGSEPPPAAAPTDALYA